MSRQSSHEETHDHLEKSLTETTKTEMDHSCPPLSPARKWLVLGNFCLAIFMEVLCSSAFFVFAAPISADLDIVFEQQTWIITAYAVTFASCLLFWGRICDLFTAKPVFVLGFLTVGLFNLVISFISDRYAFFVLRAASGVAGAAVVPAVYRLIAFVFTDPAERKRAYTLFGMTGSIANVTGTIVAGVFELITAKGQMAGWRWFFRMTTVVVAAGSVMIWVLLPQDRGHARPEHTARQRIAAMDLPGVTFMLAAQVLIIVGLTMGATYGWSTAFFLAPFILALVLYPAFFLWETRPAEDAALLPPSTWRIPNVTTLLVFGLVPLGWWSVNFMPFIQLSHVVHGETMLIAGLRTLPEGVSAFICSLLLIKYPSVTSRPKIPAIIAMGFATLAYAIWTQAPGIDCIVGTNYWAWVFPAMVFGSASMQVVLISTYVGVMLAAAKGREGVLGAMLQTSTQTSSVVALSIQAGLFTTHPGGVGNWQNIQVSWYFQLGWTALWLVGFAVFYRPQRKAVEDVENVEVVEVA